MAQNIINRSQTEFIPEVQREAHSQSIAQGKVIRLQSTFQNNAISQNSENEKHPVNFDQQQVSLQQVFNANSYVDKPKVITSHISQQFNKLNLSQNQICSNNLQVEGINVQDNHHHHHIVQNNNSETGAQSKSVNLNHIYNNKNGVIQKMRQEEVVTNSNSNNQNIKNLKQTIPNINTILYTSTISNNNNTIPICNSVNNNENNEKTTITKNINNTIVIVNSNDTITATANNSNNDKSTIPIIQYRFDSGRTSQESKEGKKNLIDKDKFKSEKLILKKSNFVLEQNTQNKNVQCQNIQKKQKRKVNISSDLSNSRNNKSEIIQQKKCLNVFIDAVPNEKADSSHVKARQGNKRVMLLPPSSAVQSNFLQKQQMIKKGYTPENVITEISSPNNQSGNNSSKRQSINSKNKPNKNNFQGQYMKKPLQQKCILEDWDSREGKTLEYSQSKNSTFEMFSQNEQ